MTGFGPYANAKVPDRKYLWTVVALFALLGLVGLGALLYRPLRLRYAIHRVEQDYKLPAPWWSVPHPHPAAPNRWLGECLDAAMQGNPRAMDVVIDRRWLGIPVGGPGFMQKSIAFVAAKAQSPVFLAALDRRGDQDEVLAILETICQDEGGFIYSPKKSRPEVLIERLDTIAKSDDPATARLGARAREFVERRFAKELAETKR